ncbi:MAG TPA: M23 family metallopeptidase [Chryseosolibacter sp.]|nr:M23 family metallopeptidase [Chryseosolibacter sp.]
MKNYWNSKLSRATVALVAAVCPFFSSAQFSPPEKKFPEAESFLYPINPGLPGSLAGTMGELRNTHFHSGLDIRTNNVIGLPVLASKSGYISRVSVGPTGYGNVIYISHPDGYTTIYAHLDRFSGDLAEYVLKEHYRKRTSSINLYFKPDQFPVDRGDTIALSGNSGSSGGPHLHFDIRDKNNFALNPLLVESFPEITDDLPPAVEKIALRTLDINSRINDRFGRFEFYAKRVGTNYVFDVPILATGNIGVEVLAKDKLAPNSRFYGGVNYIQMRVDSQLVFNQSIDKLNVSKGRHILTVMDFKTLRDRGSRFYKLFLDDGNGLNFYDKSPGDGKIHVRPGDDTDVQVTLKDSYGNSSQLSFRLRPSPLNKEVPLLEPLKSELEYDIHENVLMITAKPCRADSNRAVVYTGHVQRIIRPDYANGNRAVYLLDLRKQVPDSVVVCNGSVVPKIVATVPSPGQYHYYSDVMDVQFPVNAAYDTVYLNADHQIFPDSSEIFTLGSRYVPLNKTIKVTVRPAKNIKWNDTMGVYRIEEKGYSHLGGRWENGAVHFSTREFGNFTILQDITAPTIRPVVVNNYVARFKIQDDLSGISSFRATVDGQWLLMYYDSKTSTIWSERLSKDQLMKGEFKLTVVDEAGNRAVYTNQLK